MLSRHTISRYKLHHVLIWMVIFGTWYFLRYEDYAASSTALKITLVKVIDLAIMIYLTNYLLIPALLYRKKYLLFALSFILVVSAGSLLKMKVLEFVLDSPGLYALQGNLKTRFYNNMLPHFFLVIAGSVVKLIIDYGILQQRLVLTAMEKSTAELNFLKSQINPHFLFNSINAVYFLISKENTLARNALHQFADLLRYQLYEMNDDKISIQKEIKFLQDYVALQQLRTDEQLDVTFDPAINVENFCIEPLLLIPFVENAFKHVSKRYGQKNFVTIRLYGTKDVFHCIVENSLSDVEEEGVNRGGIGLTNVTKRLKLLYPNRHQLLIDTSHQKFTVHLSLQLQSPS